MSSEPSRRASAAGMGFEKKNSGLGAVAGPRALDGDWNAKTCRRMAEGSDIGLPSLLVEVDGQKPTGFIGEHWVCARDKSVRFANRLSGQVSQRCRIVQGFESLIGAIPAFDARLVTDDFGAFIVAGGGIARLARLGIVPSLRIDVQPSTKLATKQRKLVLRLGVYRN